MLHNFRLGIAVLWCGALVHCGGEPAGSEPNTGGSISGGAGLPGAGSSGAGSPGAGSSAGGATSSAAGFAGQPAMAGSNASGGTADAGTSGTAAGSAGTLSQGGASGSGGGGGMGGAASSGGSAGNAGGAGAPFGVCTGTPAKTVTVYVIGDSTASVYASSLYPRMGWGQPLGDLFGKACAVVSDKALSGRSSKSFFDEGAWTPIRTALKAGDYVLIQFGHNDEKSEEPTLYTDPQTTYKQYLTQYISDARAKQAIPVLLTSINRNAWSGTKLSDTHGAYPPAMRELAAAQHVDLIDMTALTKQYFERLGQTETTKLFMDLAAGQFPNYPTGNIDNTHLQEAGARKLGQLAMSNAYSQRLSLATLLKAATAAP